MKKRLMQLALSAFGIAIVTVLTSHSASAYSDSRLMDDSIFDNVNSMNEQQIRDFINSRPTSCLATSGAIFPEPITYWQYGGNVDAARVIYNSAQYNGINPQVILATLEKEQTLISRTNCYEASGIDSRNKAMGQGCPDGGQCPAPAYAGFHQQVMKGSWQLMFNRQRALGNTAWGDNGSITYSGYMTQGNYKRCASCQTIYYDGYGTVDGQTVYMSTGATASFYTYTPHLGQALPGIFEKWFGPTLVPSYGWQYVGQSSDTALNSIPAGQKAVLTVTAKNIGSTTWQKGGSNPIHLAGSHPQDRNSVFATSTWVSQSRAAVMNENSVAPGSNGTFTFTIQAPSTPGAYNEYFSFVIEGVTWLNDPGLYFAINVVSPQMSSSFTGTTAPATVLTDSSTSITATIKNTGNVTWYKDGKYPVRLGTCSPNERTSTFADTSWMSPTRPAAMNEASVAPNNSATFTFTLKAPHAPVKNTENFCLVAESYTWFGQIISVPMDVRGTYQASSNSSPTINIIAGQSASVTLTFTNPGTATWQNSGATPVKLGTANPIDRTSAFADASWSSPTRPTLLTEASVAPGGTGSFTFTLSSKPNQNGTYREYFLPVAEGQEWFGSASVVTVNVSPATYSWQLVSQQYSAGSVDIVAGETQILTVTAKNTGNTTWVNSGANPVRLGTTRNRDRTSAFYTVGWTGSARAATLHEPTVAPNETGTFIFSVKAPSSAGKYLEYFSLVAEGITWMNDPGMNFYLNVKAPIYSWQLLSQQYSSGSATMPAGGSQQLTVTAKNTGNATWSNSGSRPVRLGTSNPRDRSSIFATAGWLGSARPASLQEASVAPGATGTFTFTIKAPSMPGVRLEYFNILVENVAWMNDLGMNFYLNIQ